MTMSTIQDLAIIGFASRDVSLLQKTLYEVFSASTSLSQETVTDVIPSFITALQPTDIEDSVAIVDRIYHTAYCLQAFISVVPVHIVGIFAHDRQLITALTACYEGILSKFTSWDQPPSTARISLYSKVSIIDSLHILIGHLLSAGNHNPLIDLLSTLIDSAPAFKPNTVPFGTRSLLGDYEASFHLSHTLPSSAHPRLTSIRTSLQYLAGTATDPIGALSLILASTPHPPTQASDSKGKERAVESTAPAPDYSATISQVLDIFPDESPAFIQACLIHPFFSGDSEKLVGALLEGASLPGELEAIRRGTAELSAGSQDLETGAKDDEEEELQRLMESRKNVWDNVEMDFSRLKLGKDRETFNSVTAPSADAQLKEDILRRAREQAEEEEAEEREARGLSRRPRTVTVGFEEDLSDDDGVGGLSSPTVRLAADGEDLDGEGDDDDEQDAISRAETLLELAYMKDPKLFERDAATRRSAGRAKLKAETGWGDEQIEGWKIMLERNPRNKERMMQKHEFTGNTPLPTDALAPNRPPGGRGGGPSRGRGSGRGRGGGGGGGGASGGDHAKKDRNKAHVANHNRKRGHDKKIARGGALPTA